MKNILIRNYLLGIFSILFFFTEGNILAQNIESVSIKNLRQHMDAIASDATEGRLTGSAGYRKAADYAVTVFQEAGLKPGWINEKGEKSFLQPVPFLRNYYKSTSLTIRKNGKNNTFDHSTNDFVILNIGKGSENNQITPLAFIGYGISEPEKGWDDYADMDIKGRWVILLDGLPPENSNPAFPDNLRKKYADWKTRDSLRNKVLIEHKIAGLIIIPNKDKIDNWEHVIRRSYIDHFSYVDDEMNRKETPEPVLSVILIGPEILKPLFSGQSFDPIANKGKYHSYILDNTKLSATINCKKEPINCYNIIAIAPGTDSILKNEYLTVGAHLDHLGKIGNKVYNGANDDASGCVIILEAAKAIALNPPKRSVIFILYTAEELHGLIGSKHFLRKPPIPMDQISLNINIEQIGSKNRAYEGIWIMSPPGFKASFHKVSQAYSETNFKYDSIENFIDDLKNQVDLWTYYQKKIPAIMLSSGGFPEHHTTKDKIELIDFDHLLVAANFLHSFIVELGNEKQLTETNKTKKTDN
ncbi:M28 family peptidase [Ancylomarina sp. YFZ004]